MKPIFTLLLILCVHRGSVKQTRADEPRTLAFPGAEGAGKWSKGGRGGRVIAVTNLDDSGPGSLRAAVEAKEPRTVVFRVSGTIELQTTLRISEPFITIAGQAAPGDGICLKGRELYIERTHDVIVRYLRCRPGDKTSQPGEVDAISIMSAQDVILDHCSATWSTDECLRTLENAGAVKPKRDAVDTRIIAGVRDGTGRQPATIAADAWPVLQCSEEFAHDLNPTDATDAARVASPGGFTHLELWLNSL